MFLAGSASDSPVSVQKAELTTPTVHVVDATAIATVLPGVMTVVGAGEGLCTPVAVVVPEDAALTAI